MKPPRLSPDTAQALRDMFGARADAVTASAAQWFEVMSYADKRAAATSQGDDWQEWNHWHCIATEAAAWWQHARERERAELRRRIAR